MPESYEVVAKVHFKKYSEKYKNMNEAAQVFCLERGRNMSEILFDTRKEYIWRSYFYIP